MLNITFKTSYESSLLGTSALPSTPAVALLTAHPVMILAALPAALPVVLPMADAH